MKIGFFDSGLGGLTILKKVRAQLPEYDYLFYGDTEHVPFGDRSEDEIYTLTKKGIIELFARGAILVIVACNTASAESLRKLQDTFLKKEYPERKVLGVIIPTVETLLNIGVQRPLLIATTRTVESNKYNIELHKINPTLDISSLATPELVPLIEDNNLEMAYVKVCDAIDAVVGEIDSIILGCTHYTLLKEPLRKKYQIPVVSQDEIIPQKIKKYLDNHEEIKFKLSTGSTCEVILSEETEHYIHLKQQLL